MEQVEFEKATKNSLGRFSVVRKSFGRNNIRRLVTGMLISKSALLDDELSAQPTNYADPPHSGLLPDGWNKCGQLLQSKNIRYLWFLRYIIKGQSELTEPVVSMKLMCRLALRYWGIRYRPIRSDFNRHDLFHR
jgi:hypothetical protein